MPFQREFCPPTPTSQPHQSFSFLFSLLDSAEPVQQTSQGENKCLFLFIAHPHSAYRWSFWNSPQPFFPPCWPEGQALVSGLREGGQAVASPPKHGSPKAAQSSQSFPRKNHVVVWQDWVSGLVPVRKPVERWLALTFGSLLNFKDGVLGTCWSLFCLGP